MRSESWLPPSGERAGKRPGVCVSAGEGGWAFVNRFGVFVVEAEVKTSSAWKSVAGEEAVECIAAEARSRAISS